MSIDLRILKRCLIVLLAATSVVIMADQTYLFICPRVANYKTVPKTTMKNVFSEKEANMEPLQVFNHAVMKRNLFNVTERKISMIPQTSSIVELVKDYRLKGIAFFNAPEGIIEDAATGRSVFVKEGEKFGQVTVRQIKGESIVLSHDGEEFELKIQGGEIQ